MKTIFLTLCIVIGSVGFGRASSAHAHSFVFVRVVGNEIAESQNGRTTLNHLLNTLAKKLAILECGKIELNPLDIQGGNMNKVENIDGVSADIFVKSASCRSADAKQLNTGSSLTYAVSYTCENDEERIDLPEQLEDGIEIDYGNELCRQKSAK